MFNNGFTGRISRVDPDTGARTTVADGLPSNASVEMGEAVGPTDVAFIGDQLYYLQTHGGEDWGFPDNPTGVYRVEDDGDVTLIADIGKFNIDDPVPDVTDGVQQDIEPGGNPYLMTVRNGAFYVVDGNQNQIMRITTGGSITRIATFDGHPVSTGITFPESGGPFYVSYLGQGPFLPANGKVVTVPASGGAPTEIASGASMLTDVQFGPDGELYALQFNDTVAAGEAFFAPGTGRVLLVNDDGTFSPIVTGLSFATAMTFDDDTAYISNFGIGPGSIIKVENFSALQPIVATPTSVPATAAPQATATRPTGVTAPDTGTGDASGSGGTATWLLAVAAGGVALLAGGGALSAKRR
jgi:hypothetical protein